MKQSDRTELKIDAHLKTEQRDTGVNKSLFSNLKKLRAAVVAKKLEQRSHNLKVLSLNPPGARAFSSSSINNRVSLIRSLKRGASLLFFLFPIIPLAVLPEAKQA